VKIKFLSTTYVTNIKIYLELFLFLATNKRIEIHFDGRGKIIKVLNKS